MMGQVISWNFFISIIVAFLLLTSCAPTTKVDRSSRKTGKATQRPYSIKGKTYYPIPSAVGFRQRGLASWYGGKFHGRKTANGETYDMYGNTAAHKTLPMNTMLLVRNLDNGRESVVRINDRGPFVRGRIVDLSYAMAQELGMIKNGTAKVEVIALQTKKIKPPVKKAKPSKPFPEKEISPFELGNFYVQIGAFVAKKNAKLEAIRFSVRGRDVIIQQYATSGRNLYRVLVRGGRTLPDAEKYRQKLAMAGYSDTMVIAR